MHMLSCYTEPYFPYSRSTIHVQKRTHKESAREARMEGFQTGAYLLKTGENDAKQVKEAIDC